MNEKLITECVAASFAGTANFGEIVGKLTADGVEWYSANLILRASTHYAAAGTVYYTVHLQGRKAIYFGRHGDFHIELFPQ